jgi:hypothetical protein
MFLSRTSPAPSISSFGVEGSEFVCGEWHQKQRPTPFARYEPRATRSMLPRVSAGSRLHATSANRPTKTTIPGGTTPTLYGIAHRRSVGVFCEPNVPGVSRTGRPACRSRSGTPVAANKLLRSEWRPATSVTPSRWRWSRQLGCRAEAGPWQLHTKVGRRAAIVVSTNLSELYHSGSIPRAFTPARSGLCNIRCVNKQALSGFLTFPLESVIQHRRSLSRVSRIPPYTRHANDQRSRVLTFG